MNHLLIELQYFPPICYFTLLQGFDRLYVEKYEHYQKQTYRNRCYIQSARGREILIVPLVHGTGKTVIKDIRIDYGQKWLNNHWRTIQSAYGKAPFFEHYQQDVHDTLFRRHAFLYDLNYDILMLCIRLLRHNIHVLETTSYETDAGAGISDFRSVLNPKRPDSCQGIYKPVEYPQVFGNRFAENLSIMDLLFCEGPASLAVVRTSAIK